MEYNVSLCGCIRIPADRIHFRNFIRRVEDHYKKHPECRKKAEQNRVWQMRQPIPEETCDDID